MQIARSSTTVSGLALGSYYSSSIPSQGWRCPASWESPTPPPLFTHSTHPSSLRRAGLTLFSSSTNHSPTSLRTQENARTVDPSFHHREILLSCLNLMKGGLKKNICDLDNYASLDKVEDLPARRKARIGDVSEYACLFWAKHLTEIPSSGHGTKEVCEATDEFSVTRLHFGLRPSSSWGILMSRFMPLTTSSGGTPRLGNVDSMIRDTPSEIYHYTLPLSPSLS